MALTFTSVLRLKPIGQGILAGVVDVTFDASYPLGGEAVTAANLGVRRLVNFRAPGMIVAASNLLFPLTTKRVSDTSWLLVAATAAGDGDPLDELDDTSNLLSGLVVRCDYWGS